MLAAAARRLHDGTQMGFVWQLLVFLGGVLPAVLAVTNQAHVVASYRAQIGA